MAGACGLRLGCDQQMSPAEVIQHLMAGVSMETGYAQRDQLKVKVTEQSDTRAWAMFNEHDENVTTEFVMRKPP